MKAAMLLSLTLLLAAICAGCAANNSAASDSKVKVSGSMSTGVTTKF